MTGVYRPPVPPPKALVRWPDGFGRRFLVSIDTEEEFDWDGPLASDNRSVSAIALLPEAAARFADWGVPLTYMIDYPVATDQRSVDAIGPLLERAGAALGAQLHPWVNPPLEEELTVANSFVGRSPRALEAAKLDQLIAVLTNAWKTRLLAYRAGRYGIGPNTAALLAERGIAIDSSMRPGFSYTGEGGPDFSRLGNAAYRLSDAVVELPLTTVFTGLARQRRRLYQLAGAVPKGRGVLARTGLISRVPLTPEGVPAIEAARAIEQAVTDGERLLNFSFHSPTLVPGNTPYVRDQAELDRFWRWWDEVLVALDRLDVKPIGLRDVIAACS